MKLRRNCSVDAIDGWNWLKKSLDIFFITQSPVGKVI